MTLFLAVVEQPPVHVGLAEAGIVLLTTAIVFFILGPRLAQDIRGWFTADRPG